MLHDVTRNSSQLSDANQYHRRQLCVAVLSIVCSLVLKLFSGENFHRKLSFRGANLGVAVPRANGRRRRTEIDPVGLKLRPNGDATFVRFDACAPTCCQLPSIAVLLRIASVAFGPVFFLSNLELLQWPLLDLFLHRFPLGHRQVLSNRDRANKFSILRRPTTTMATTMMDGGSGFDLPLRSLLCLLWRLGCRRALASGSSRTATAARWRSRCRTA